MDRKAILGEVFSKDSNKIVYAIKCTGCPKQDIEDVLNQTALTALENFEQLKDPSKAVSWCISIAVNIAKRKMERDRKLRLVDFFDEEEYLSLQEEAVYDINEDEIENAEIRMDLKRLLDKVSPEFTIPLQLKVLYGFSYEEIAEMLDVKVGTVRSRINRAKKLLEKAILNERRSSEGKL